MKDMTRQNRLVQIYHPYFPPSPPAEVSAFSFKASGGQYVESYSNSSSGNISGFVTNSGMYESDSDDSHPGSPFHQTKRETPPVDEYVDDMINTIDFSDLFNIQKHEQEESIRCAQLELILEQVRHDSITSFDSDYSDYSTYNYSPVPNTPENNTFSAMVKSETSYPSPPPTVQYTQMSPVTPLTPTAPPSPPPPQPQASLQSQQASLYNNAFEYTSKHEPLTTKPTKRSYAGADDHNDKIRLYEFVLHLLNDGRTDCIRWLCPIEGEFEITNSSKIARLWGDVKKNPTMTYEKFARALRHYYKLGILINYKHKEKLRYKFSQEILLKNKRSLMELQ